MPGYSGFSQTYTHCLSIDELEEKEIIWELPNVELFDELVLLWNGKRPPTGRYSFFISVRQNSEWSPWLYYAEWASQGQIMFKDLLQDSFAFTHEGRVTPKTGYLDGFRVQVIASGGATLKEVKSLSACILNKRIFMPVATEPSLSFILLKSFPRQSQIGLRHFRYLDLALPVCMSLVVNYWKGESTVDPLKFAEAVIDDDTGFYENWSFNAAEASSYLKGKEEMRMLYLPNFSTLYAALLKGTPVVVSISGWIPGSPRPFRTEHAICVIGYEPIENKVHCIDPGFPNDKATYVAYFLPDFLKCWAKNYNKALILQR